MAQLAEIVLAILGLCGVVSLKPICITILCCEVFRTIADYVNAKRRKENKKMY